MKLRCPDCRKTFPWAAKEPWPEYCPMCRACIHEPNDEEVICMPFVSSRGLVKSSEQLFRKMSSGSEQRQEMAAAHLGVDKSDVAELKITDLKDARNPGEVAAVDASAAEKRLAAASPTTVGFQPNGAEFAAGISTGAVTVNGVTRQGIAPRAGANAIGKMQRIMGRT